MPRSIGPKFPIIVTSYEVAMNDAKQYLRHQEIYFGGQGKFSSLFCPHIYLFLFVIIFCKCNLTFLLQGHMLKIPKCKLLRELKLLTVENKLLLTGTPLHNNLVELWLLLKALFFLIYSHLKKNSIHGNPIIMKYHFLVTNVFLSYIY